MDKATGPFYYPNPLDKRERMYVRENEDGQIEFRLWHRDHPEIWEQHGWLDLEIIKKAAKLYAGKDNPLKLYDIVVARAVLKDWKQKK
ncbi:MAG: hypothetical protein Q9M37_03900 [Desulfonauticus sp.]|nr:hypothetical protein [Desulfonauticus sp.]